jgi:hypothetical protein
MRGKGAVTPPVTGAPGWTEKGMDGHADAVGPECAESLVR